MTTEPITSLTNERVKAAVRLRDRRHRDRSGLTIVDGARELRRAIEAGVEIDTVFVSDAAAATDDGRWIVAHLDRAGPGGSSGPGGSGGSSAATAVVTVSRAVLEKIAFGKRDEGVVGVVRTPPLVLDDLVVPREPLIVVADGIEKPGNLGAIVRTADGAGADAVLVADARTDPYNPNVIRASVGAIFGIPLAVAEPAVVLAWLRARNVRLITAEVAATRLHTDADLTGPVAIVVGSEAHGLGPGWLAAERERVRISMHGRADSLNVSAALAVLLYEARRQRDQADPAERHGPIT